MLLYSLPATFENFRCAIESRDELPSPEILKTKIIEENDVRRDEKQEVPGAMAVSSKNKQNKGNYNQDKTTKSNKNKYASQVQCYRCHKFGHKAKDCRVNISKTQGHSSKDNVSLFSSAKSTNQNNTLWCLDSGCTSHLCNDLDLLTNVKECQQKRLNLANGETTEINAKGTVQLKINCSISTNHVKNVDVNDVLYVPDLKMNLLSISKITDKGLSVIFKDKEALIKNKNNETVLVADRIGDLYYLRNERIETNNVEISRKSDTENWHCKLGHLNLKDLNDMSRNGIIPKLSNNLKSQNFNCEVCLRGKMSRAPLPSESNRKSKLLEIIHSDVCGPMRTDSLGGSKYFVTFTDDYSRWTEIYFIKHKSEVLEKFKEFKEMVENKFGCKIKYIQSDNGTEYVNKQFDDYLRKHGIQRRLSISYTPEQNGVSERKNRTLLDMARCLLIQSGLPSSFWAEAVNTSNYIRNRCPTTSLDGLTPYHLWFKRPPNLSYLQNFGCIGYRLNKSQNNGKFEPRSERCIFIGYSNNSKGYKVYLPNKRKFEVVRDVKFLSAIYSNNHGDFEEFYENSTNDVSISNRQINDSAVLEKGKDSSCNDSNSDVEIDDDDTGNGQFKGDDGAINNDGSSNKSITMKRGPGRPQLERTGMKGRPRKKYNMVEQVNEADIGDIGEEWVFAAEVSIDEAINGPSSDEWLEAIAVELRSIIRNETWEVIERPKIDNVIGSRFVLTNKFGSNGKITKRKARLVARGFNQRYGIEFNDTFSPVAKMDTIRMAVCLAVQFGMEIHQLDVTTAYLYSHVDETIYMNIPKYLIEGLQYMVEKSNDNRINEEALRMLSEIRKGNRVCRLNKALYGLRQAGRQWYKKLHDVLKSFGATASNYDPCLYYIGQGEDILIIVVYVDDILILARDLELINKLKKHLSVFFETKDLGKINYCLGIEFNQTENSIFMKQSKYIDELLRKFRMDDCKPADTPMEKNLKLRKADNCDNKPYRELIGSLMYLSVSTRPDITHVVSVLSQFNDCHNEEHWVAAKRVLRYLKKTRDLGILFQKTNLPLTGYVDADWGGCIVDRKSYSGYVFTLCNAPVSWNSRKQKTVALSTTEAEYVALAEAAKQMVYLINFLEELGFNELINTTLYNDNMSAQKLAENPTFHDRTKHIDIRHHYIRDVVQMGMVTLKYCPSEKLVADLLTKSLSGVKHHQFISSLNMASSRGGVKCEWGCDSAYDMGLSNLENSFEKRDATD